MATAYTSLTDHRALKSTNSTSERGGRRRRRREGGFEIAAKGSNDAF
jgi:hypothetical protein